jgi:hypothetical protein
MSRFGGVFWFVLVIAAGVTNFIVKQTVQNLDDQLNDVRRKTVTEQKKIHELTADWTFLNQPELLADLNSRYVHLMSVSPKQVTTSIDGIPLRPAPPPQDVAPQIADAAPVTRPTLPPPAPKASAPIVPVSVSAPAHIVTAPAELIAPAPPQTVAAPHPASLDALFAQVTGDR